MNTSMSTTMAIFDEDSIKKEIETVLLKSDDLKAALALFNHTKQKAVKLRQTYDDFQQERESLLLERERINDRFGEDNDPMTDRLRLQEIHSALKSIEQTALPLSKKTDPGLACSVDRDIRECEARIREIIDRLIAGIHAKYQKIIDDQSKTLAGNIGTYRAACSVARCIDSGEYKVIVSGLMHGRIELMNHDEFGLFDMSVINRVSNIRQDSTERHNKSTVAEEANHETDDNSGRDEKKLKDLIERSRSKRPAPRRSTSQSAGTVDKKGAQFEPGSNLVDRVSRSIRTGILRRSGKKFKLVKLGRNGELIDYKPS